MKKDTKGSGIKSTEHFSETGSGPTQGAHQHFVRSGKAPTAQNTGASGPSTTKCKY